jgi:hypothetical protein
VSPHDPELPFASGCFRVPKLPAVTKLSGRKLQLPLNRLKARLFAQRVQEWVGLQKVQAWITQPPRRPEPFERLRPIAPLRIDRSVLVRPAVAVNRLGDAMSEFSKYFIDTLTRGSQYS